MTPLARKLGHGLMLALLACIALLAQHAVASSSFVKGIKTSAEAGIRASVSLGPSEVATMSADGLAAALRAGPEAFNSLTFVLPQSEVSDSLAILLERDLDYFGVASPEDLHTAETIPAEHRHLLPNLAVYRARVRPAAADLDWNAIDTTESPGFFTLINGKVVGRFVHPTTGQSMIVSRAFDEAAETFTASADSAGIQLRVAVEDTAAAAAAAMATASPVGNRSAHISPSEAERNLRRRALELALEAIPSNLPEEARQRLVDKIRESHAAMSLDVVRELLDRHFEASGKAEKIRSGQISIPMSHLAKPGRRMAARSVAPSAVAANDANTKASYVAVIPLHFLIDGDTYNSFGQDVDEVATYILHVHYGARVLFARGSQESFYNPVHIQSPADIEIITSWAPPIDAGLYLDDMRRVRNTIHTISPTATVHGISTLNFTYGGSNGIVGIAFTDAVCENASVGLSKVVPSSVAFVAETMVHEMAHHFNVAHDDDDIDGDGFQDCPHPNHPHEHYVMTAAVPIGSISQVWSSCSAMALDDYILTSPPSKTSCIFNSNTPATPNLPNPLPTGRCIGIDLRIDVDSFWCELDAFHVARCPGGQGYRCPTNTVCIQEFDGSTIYSALCYDGDLNAYQPIYNSAARLAPSVLGMAAAGALAVLATLF